MAARKRLQREIAAIGRMIVRVIGIGPCLSGLGDECPMAGEMSSVEAGQ